MNRFENVCINNYDANLIALLEAQKLTNERAETFLVYCDDCIYEGLIFSVDDESRSFVLQMTDGTKTLHLNINSLENIEMVERWKFDYDKRNSFKIYVDDLRPAPLGYIQTQSVVETIALIETIEDNGAVVECLDLDHDLGDFEWLGGDAIKIIDYLVKEHKYYSINIHTANPVGRANMLRAINRYWP